MQKMVFVIISLLCVSSCINGMDTARMASDNYGRTIFSMAVYLPIGDFGKLLKIYSLDELNMLCQTICFNREINNPALLRRAEIVERIVEAGVCGRV